MAKNSSTKKLGTATTKAIDQVAEQIERAKAAAAESKQPRFAIDRRTVNTFFNQIYGIAKDAIFNEPSYAADSAKRDTWLAKVVRKEPYLLGILQSVVSIDKNRGWTLVGGKIQVKKFVNILHSFQVSPDLYGWRNGLSVSAQSFYQADLGTVVEIGRSVTNGPLAALYTVDPTKCHLTGKMETPLKYNNGARDKQMWEPNDYFRVASFPSPTESMNGLGYCAVSRCLELAKLLVSVFEHDRESLGSKAPKGILTINGVSLDQWLQSLEESTDELKSLEREYYSGVQVLAGDEKEIKVSLTSLSNLPTQFDHREFTDMIIYGYALAFGYDPREFWPVSSGSLGTSRETEEQHRKATSKGGLDFALGFQEKLQEELPETLEFEFEQRDVQGDIAEVEFEKQKLAIIDQMYKSVNARGETLVTYGEARQLLVDAKLIPDDWTLPEEDVQITDTDDMGEIVEKQRVQNALSKFPDDDIVIYSENNGKYRTIRKAGQKKFMIRMSSKPVYLKKKMSIKKRASGNYEAIRNSYWASIYDAVEGYLTSDRPVTAFRNSMLIAMSEAFTATVYDGYEEAGGELPLDDSTQSWLSDRIATERGFIVDVFARLKEEWDGLDPIAEAFARADGYAATLDSIWVEARMRGGENATLEFGGEDGTESCAECLAMKGKKHTIKYILENDLIPYPGTDQYSCGGYKCSHFWFNPKTGEEYVV